MMCTDQCLVSVHNEWDPLEEVIIGSAVGAYLPAADVSTWTLEYADAGYTGLAEVPTGRIPDRVIEETEQELDLLCKTLTDLDVVVRRPDPVDHSATIATPDWQATGCFDYCPRDSLLAIGDTILEVPMVLRSRYFETFAYKSICLEYLASGARWIAAPRPRLADELYQADAPSGLRLRNCEPAFDAANILRFGTDILYLVSDSGNELGATWLQSTLGNEYQVHPCRSLYDSSHVDTTLAALRPGLLLVNPERVAQDNLPDFLRNWDRIQCPQPVDTGYTGDGPPCSLWIGMNLLVVRPGLAVVDQRQTDLIRCLEQHGVDVIALQLTHARLLRGGFHCVSLDVRRRGGLETYR